MKTKNKSLTAALDFWDALSYKLYGSMYANCMQNIEDGFEVGLFSTYTFKDLKLKSFKSWYNDLAQVYKILPPYKKLFTADSYFKSFSQFKEYYKGSDEFKFEE